MNDQFSNAFIHRQGKKYLNLSGAFGGYDLGHQHPHFAKRAKNYLKLQNSYFEPCSVDTKQYLFFYQAIPWLKEFPYLYLLEDLKGFLGDQKITFASNQSHFEKIDAHFCSNLSSIKNEDSTTSITSENFLRFNPSPENKNFILAHSLFFLMQNNFSESDFICIFPNLSLIYPVKKLLFSKKDMSLNLGFCETSRRLYRDFFKYVKNVNIFKNIDHSSEHFKKDLDVFKNEIDEISISKNYFKVRLKKSISSKLTKTSKNSLNFSESFAFIHQDDTLYLSCVYHKNPAIFEKKLRKLLASII